MDLFTVDRAMVNASGASAPTPMAIRRREFVSREIELAGMQLFAERGYENVSIAEIAAAAGVSRRSFFRHFESKAELLHAYATRLSLRVLAALRRRPPEEPAVEALFNVFLETAEMTPEEQAVSLLRNRVLQQTRQDTGGAPEVIEDIVNLIAVRLDVDPSTDIRPRLLVWTAFAAARTGSKIWVERGGVGTLQEHIQIAFQYMLDGWGSIQSQTQGRSNPSMARKREVRGQRKS
jgi:AcrR family transcriptional regulator